VSGGDWGVKLYSLTVCLACPKLSHQRPIANISRVGIIVITNVFLEGVQCRSFARLPAPSNHVEMSVAFFSPFGLFYFDRHTFRNFFVVPFTIASLRQIRLVCWCDTRPSHCYIV